MKKYIKPDTKVFEIDTESIMLVNSNTIGWGDTPIGSDDMNAPVHRGSGWEEYEN